ncbi:MAG: hypothetical protein SNJ71_04635 [Bacteroidales bacterium]
MIEDIFDSVIWYRLHNIYINNDSNITNSKFEEIATSNIDILDIKDDTFDLTYQILCICRLINDIYAYISLITFYDFA